MLHDISESSETLCVRACCWWCEKNCNLEADGKDQRDGSDCSIMDNEALSSFFQAALESYVITLWGSRVSLYFPRPPGYKSSLNE